jgi:single-stranded DNA-binding protein
LPGAKARAGDSGPDRGAFGPSPGREPLPQAATTTAALPAFREEEHAMDSIGITLTGRLGNDPVLSTTRNGKSRLYMTVAVDSSRGRENEPPLWIGVKAFGVLADRAAASLRKGDLVTVRADNLETWVTEDRQNPGQHRAGLAVLAYDLAASVRFGTLITERAAQQPPQDTQNVQDTGDQADGFAVLSTEEQANRSVLDGITA